MTALLAASAGLLGLVIGSFLNVVIWRLPRGESVVRPASACPGCHAPVRPRDNVPVLGWLLLRGRCRDCRASISVRYPVVELSTAVLFAALAVRLGPDPVLPAYLYLGAVGIALAMIDLDVRRLPNALTYPSYPIVLALLAVGLLGDPGAGTLVRAVLGGLAMLAFYFVLVLLHPRGMGLGDVKLSGVLGLCTAWLGWGPWAVGLMSGFVLGGAFGIAVMATGSGGRKTAIPFGPFMIAGALLAVFAGSALSDAYLSLATG